MILERIKEYIDFKGINTSNFERSVGMSNASFGKSLKSGGAIGTDKLENILKVYRDINIEWLLTGVGAMIKPEITEEVKPLICQEPSIGVPYYDVDFIGGFEVVINDQTIVPTHNIVFEPFKEADFWCNATGNSMAKKINHGDVIALKKVDSVDDILFGEIYAVVLESRRTIKILRKSKDPTKLRFIPANTMDYDEQEFPISQIRKIYAVLGSIRKFF